MEKTTMKIRSLERFLCLAVAILFVVAASSNLTSGVGESATG
jgi:hypothetical protein